MKKIAFDKSSLLLFRIFFGCFILFEVYWTFIANFSQIYDVENGFFGRFFLDSYIQYYAPVNPLFYILTSNFLLQSYLAFIFILIVLYIFGFFPRIISLLITLFLGALYAKYNILLSGWPQYMLCLLFLSSFFIENTKPKEKQKNYWYEFVLLFQIGFIYFFNAISKNGENWLNGTAIKLCFTKYPLTTAFGNTLLEYPGLLKIATYGSLVFELLILFLLLFLFNKKWVRILTAISLVLFHLGIQVTMQVGHFYLVAISIAILIFPIDNFPDIRKIITKLCSIKKYSPEFIKSRYYHNAVALVYIYCIVLSNVYLLKEQTCRKNNLDFNETVVSSFYSGKINYVPFFYQYWHFFAPDPPVNTGVVAFIGKYKDNSHWIIYNGDIHNSSNFKGILKYLSAYISLKDYNIKDKLFIESYLRQQFYFWNVNPANKRLSTFGLYEFYKIRYIDKYDADALMLPEVNKNLKLSFDLNYK